MTAAQRDTDEPARVPARRLAVYSKIPSGQ
jgi:hypothetical protein